MCIFSHLHVLVEDVVVQLKSRVGDVLHLLLAQLLAQIERAKEVRRHREEEQLQYSTVHADLLGQFSSLPFLPEAVTLKWHFSGDVAKRALALAWPDGRDETRVKGAAQLRRGSRRRVAWRARRGEAGITKHCLSFHVVTLGAVRCSNYTFCRAHSPCLLTFKRLRSRPGHYVGHYRYEQESLLRPGRVRVPFPME